MCSIAMRLAVVVTVVTMARKRCSGTINKLDGAVGQNWRAYPSACILALMSYYVRGQYLSGNGCFQ